MNAGEVATQHRAEDAKWSPTDLVICGRPPVTGTVLYNIPAVAPHLLGEPPLAHVRDGDGFILAMSFSDNGVVWARSRFVRTRFFLREAKERRRRYRGRYGTPGASGLLAPSRPKAACADGISVWGEGKRRRAIAFGGASLPMAIDLVTLVSKRYTAMGKALTDDEALLSERGTEMSSAPVHTPCNTLAFCAKARTVAGRVLGLYICEIDSQFNLLHSSTCMPFSSDYHLVQMVPTRTHYVLFLYKLTAGAPKAFNRLASIFGAGSGTKLEDPSPGIDTAFGTKVVFVALAEDGSPRGSICSVQLPEMLITACANASTKPLSKGTTGELSQTARDCVIALDVAAVSAESVASLAAVADTVTGVDVLRDGATSLRRIEVEIRSGSESGTRSQRKQDFNCVAQLSSDTSLTDAQEEYSFYAPMNYAVSGYSDGSCSRIMSAAARKSTGTCGLAALDLTSGDIQYWDATQIAPSVIVSRPTITTDNRYAVVLITGSNCDAAVAVFDTEDVAGGPRSMITLPKSRYGPCMGSVWCEDAFSWDEHGSKLPYSAYELFDDKNWNDMNSSFSSLGLNQ